MVEIKWVSLNDRLPDIDQEVLILLEVDGNIERGLHIGRGNFKANWCSRRGTDHTYDVKSWCAFKEVDEG